MPCCQRLPGPAGSQTAWVSNSLFSSSRHFLGRQSTFEHILKIFVNLKGSKSLSRLESLTFKSSNEKKTKQTKQNNNKKQAKQMSRFFLDEWIQHDFFCPTMSFLRHAQVNSQNYLTMWQIIKLFTVNQKLIWSEWKITIKIFEQNPVLVYEGTACPLMPYFTQTHLSLNKISAKHSMC